MTTFYRTRITIDVLSETPIPPDAELAGIVREGEEGSYVIDEERFNEETLSGREMAVALWKAGSTPDFFMLDDDGNRIEE